MVNEKKSKHKVIVYSTPTCPWCHKAKDFLKENGISFEDVDVAENKERAKEMIEKSGQMGVPVIDIDGDILIGFDKEEMIKLLDL
jgi:glutaredoxin 3